MKKKIVVLGAGLVGKAIAEDLHFEFDVTSADISEDAVQDLKRKGINARKFDVTNREELIKFLQPFDCVVGAVPGYLGFKTVEAVIEAGKNMVDISFFPEDAFFIG